MVKKKVFAAIAISSLAVVGVTSVAVTANNNLTSGNAVKSNCLDITEKMVADVDGIASIKTKDGNTIHFKVSGVNADGTGKVLSLNKDGIIENIDPIQNLTKLYIEGKAGEEIIKNDMVANSFLLSYGYVKDEATLQGKVMTTLDATMKQEYGISGNPSYFSLKATEAVTLDKLAIDYSCENSGKHTPLPEEYVDLGLSFMGKDGKWDINDETHHIPFPQNPKNLTEYIATISLKAGEAVKIVRGTNWGFIDKDKDYDRGEGSALKAGQITINNDGNITAVVAGDYTIVYKTKPAAGQGKVWIGAIKVETPMVKHTLKMTLGGEYTFNSYESAFITGDFNGFAVGKDSIELVNVPGTKTYTADIELTADFNGKKLGYQIVLGYNASSNKPAAEQGLLWENAAFKSKECASIQNGNPQLSVTEATEIDLGTHNWDSHLLDPNLKEEKTVTIKLVNNGGALKEGVIVALRGTLVGSWNDPVAMTKVEGEDAWTYTTTLKPGTYEFKFVGLNNEWNGAIGMNGNNISITVTNQDINNTYKCDFSKIAGDGGNCTL